jgi:hypothetical protein
MSRMCFQLSAMGLRSLSSLLPLWEKVEPPPNEWTPVVGSQSQEVSNGKK